MTRYAELLCALALAALGLTVLAGMILPPHCIMENTIAGSSLLACAAGIYKGTARQCQTSKRRRINLLWIIVTIFMLMLEAMALYQIIFEKYPVFG